MTYTPATNASGTASITLTLSDDGGTPGTPGDDATSPPQTFTITVNAANNAPTFVVGPNQSMNEDSAAQTVSGWATAIDDRRAMEGRRPRREPAIALKGR